MQDNIFLLSDNINDIDYKLKQSYILLNITSDIQDDIHTLLEMDKIDKDYELNYAFKLETMLSVTLDKLQETNKITKELKNIINNINKSTKNKPANNKV